MLRYAAISLAIAAIAFFIAFFATMLAGGAVWLAKIIFIVALLAFIAFFALDMINRKKKRKG